MEQRDEYRVRLDKYERWVASNKAYPNMIVDRVWMKECQLDAEAVDEKVWHVAGRVMLRRDMGKACFMTLEDVSGRLQLYARLDVLGEDVFSALVDVDLGDIIEASGTLFLTKTGETTLRLAAFGLLSKSLNPFPDKFHGISDRELCYRQRYVDLMVNPQTRERFLKRVLMVDVMRGFLKNLSFVEVETPMLHALAGGAMAKPFVTHHNALDMELFLRIAPELHLKRLLVGGFERVFEINRNFRNEGLSTRHNPEFTMIEFYQAYARVDDMINLTETLLREIVLKVCGCLQLTYQGNAIDFEAPFCVMTLVESITVFYPDLDINNEKHVRDWLKDHQLPDDGQSLDHLHLVIFEEMIESRLIQPTFITQYPTSVSPLARRSDDNPNVVDRFELFIAGYEVANAFSELNDPVDQAARFKAQMVEKAGGADETMPYDDDYVNALSYGMPPAAGEGIGIDRLAMILTDAASIRDVILFPLMRPH